MSLTGRGSFLLNRNKVVRKRQDHPSAQALHAPDPRRTLTAFNSSYMADDHSHHPSQHDGEEVVPPLVPCPPALLPCQPCSNQVEPKTQCRWTKATPRASACFFFFLDAMACIHPVAKLPSENRPSYAAVIDMHATGNRSLALVHACRLTCQRLQQSKLPDVSLLVPATPERLICSCCRPGGAPAIQVKCKQDRSTLFFRSEPVCLTI